MANTAKVTSEQEVYLGGTRFPVVGQVREESVSLLPGKVTIGEYSIADDQIASTLAITDQRGGILVEEMDESIHLDRCWWTDLDLGYKGHKVLPPLATAVIIPSWLTPTSVTDPSTSWTNEANAIDDNTGTFASETIAANSWSGYLEFNITSAYVGGIRYWAERENATVDLIDVDIYYGGAWHDCYEAAPGTDGAWAYTAGDGHSGVTSVRVRFYVDGGVGKWVKLYEVDIFAAVSGSAIGSFKAGIEFNSKTYLAFDTCITKIGTEGVGIDLVTVLDANITAVSKGTGGNLYWMIGDGANYYWMDTSDAFTQEGTAYTKCIYWDGKLCAFKSDGNMEYSTDPNGAPPTWDATVDDSGSLSEILDDNDLQDLITYRDAAGDDIIYARTKKGVFAYDLANTKWLETELKLPNHPNGGKGGCVWNDALLVSAGLHIDSYQTGQARATITSVGLDKDDGLPAEYDGEIVDLIADYSERAIYAVVDSTQVTGTSTSGLYKKTQSGWLCVWKGSATEKVMTKAIITSSPNYTLWFDHDDIMYYITLQRGIQNPKKISTYTYGADGAELYSWFDAAWPGSKTALSVVLDLAGMSANETVILKYRINHSNTDLDTGWTTFGEAIVADGETERVFRTDFLEWAVSTAYTTDDWRIPTTANGFVYECTTAGTSHAATEPTWPTTIGDTVSDGTAVWTCRMAGIGLEFRSIQFRLDLARGSTNTNSPDVLSFKLRFTKNLDLKKGHVVTLDLGKTYKDNSPAVMRANLKTLADTKTLSEFVYRDDNSGLHTHKVRILSYRGVEGTGPNMKGLIQVRLVAP